MNRDGPLRVPLVAILVPDHKVWLCRALEQRAELEFHAVHGPEKHGTAPADVGRIGLKHEVVAKHRYLAVGPVDLTWIPTGLRSSNPLTGPNTSS